MSKPNKKGRNPLLRRTRPFVVSALIWICHPHTGFAQVLPPVTEAETNRLATAPRLFVREFKFEGNTAFTVAELSQVTASYTNREIFTTELEQARRAVSLHYVTRGYINSGAVIPDQDPTNGLIRIRIVEGRLTGINLHDNRWLSDRYIKSRVGLWSEAPLNMNVLRDGLQSLRQNPNVEQVNAELKPGAVPGESQLDLRVEDQHPFRVGLQADNQRPPTVGAAQFWLLASDQNLTGNSDPLELRYGIANMAPDGLEFSGVDNLEGSYRIPFTRYDTTVGLRGSRLNTLLVEETFEDLDIESLTTTYGVELRQPFFKTANREFALSLAIDHARNKTWLDDVPFALSPGATSDGEMKVSSLRFSQEWMQRGQNNVLALRSTFNFGLDVLDSTHNGVAGDPDGTYFSWLGQAQYLQRLFKTQNQLVLRLSGQWTDDRLLALEQMSIGGFDTVRGYLENQLVRDRGVVASAEVRVPVLFNKAGEGIVFLAPFADLGSGWNVNAVEEDEPSGTLNTIWSLGAGLLVSPNKHFSAQVYWGYRFRDIDEPKDAGAQGAGISFRLNVEAF